MSEQLYISSSPHIHGNASTRRVMLDVILALLPAVVAGTVIFGLASLFTVAFCVVSCVLMELACRVIMRRKQTVGDLSAVVTGILLGLCMPVSISSQLHLTLVGSFTAIVVVKQMFGGLGNNFVNPALAGRIVMLVSFPSQMTDWSSRLDLDGVTAATPLASGTATDPLKLLLGNHGGCIGETCALVLLLGGAYLCLRRVIKPIIPLCYIGTVALLSLFVSIWIPVDILGQVLGGGLLLGAIFMATDYVTSPVSNWGKVIYAVGCGVLTTLIRLFASLPEGVSYAILLMNITVPLIERFTLRKGHKEVR